MFAHCIFVPPILKGGTKIQFETSGEALSRPLLATGLLLISILKRDCNSFYPPLIIIYDSFVINFCMGIVKVVKTKIDTYYYLLLQGSLDQTVKTVDWPRRSLLLYLQW